jgi:hypothetical protein
VWRGGVGIEPHVASAEAVLAAGGVFVLMAEGGIPGPPDRLAPFRSGSALIAIRTGAPIVPLAIVGSKELYIGRRMATRVLPPTSAAALLGDAMGGACPRAHGPSSTGPRADPAARRAPGAAVTSSPSRGRPPGGRETVVDLALHRPSEEVAGSTGRG